MTATALAAKTLPPLTAQGHVIDGVECMRDCTPLLEDVDALRRQMSDNGYVYLPGYLGRERVRAARLAFIEKMQKAGVLRPDRDPMDAAALPGAAAGFSGGPLDQIFDNPRPVHDVLYRGPMIEFFERFLGENVLHYDYTWTRQVNPGPATPMHADVVYMGRGTHELYTAWTPMGDNGFDLGGLIVLEGSNNHAGLAKRYFQRDVDTFCENKPTADAGATRKDPGALWGTANQLRRSLGARRWVTADYKMGDVVLFNVYTVHGGTDNTSDRVRLSTDTRYQRASAPADHRWIGASPIGHSSAAKRGLIC